MAKLKITVDILQFLLEGVFKKYDYVIDDKSNELLNQKKIREVLNIKYYKFKHRLTNKSAYLESFKEKVENSFALVELNPNLNIEYYNKTFMACPSLSLTYSIPTSYVPLLEDFIAHCNNEVVGNSITATIGEETYKIKLFFGALNEIDVQTNSVFGENSTCCLTVSFIISENIYSFEDYSFKLGETEDDLKVFNPLSFGNDRSMIPKSMPFINSPNAAAQLNISNTQVFSFKFYAKYGDITETLSNMATDEQIDNNKPFFLEITKGGVPVLHQVVIANISHTTDDGVGYDLYTVTFTKRGKR